MLGLSREACLGVVSPLVAHGLPAPPSFARRVGNFDNIFNVRLTSSKTHQSVVQRYCSRRITARVCQSCAYIVIVLSSARVDSRRTGFVERIPCREPRGLELSVLCVDESVQASCCGDHWPHCVQHTNHLVIVVCALVQTCSCTITIIVAVL